MRLALALLLLSSPASAMPCGHPGSIPQPRPPTTGCLASFDVAFHPPAPPEALDPWRHVDVTRTLATTKLGRLTTRVDKRDLARALMQAGTIRTALHGDSWLCLRSEKRGADYIAVYSGVHTYATCVYWSARFQVTFHVRANGDVEVAATAEEARLSDGKAVFQ